ncbi:flavodoxin [Alphaproteobacteria bacterium]|nr:flavodoxin [Alphaproteobacteria bacterium]
MSVTVIYGSDNGTTQDIANRIAKKLSGRVVNITAATKADFEGADLLILGSPTYGLGNLQPDWEDNLSKLKEANLSGKKIAIFGVGDQASYPDTFVDAIGLLYDEAIAKGANVVGSTETSGYDFSASMGVRDGKFVGLAIDMDNQGGKTNARIDAWVAQLS